MNKNQIRKRDYFIDIFKGTCELNNYTPTGLSIKETLNKDLIERALTIMESAKSLEKMYFYSPIIEGDMETLKLGALINATDIYRVGELINLAIKILKNAGLYDAHVNIEGLKKELLENLETIDIDVRKIENFKNSKDQTTSFDIVLEDRTICRGGVSDKCAYFIMDYSGLEDLLDYEEKDTLDVFIEPQAKDVLDDAFAISTNLKDAGFKVETNFELSEKLDDIDADFQIRFDSKDIEKYVVHLKDLKTKEEREIMIDNLVEELSFI